jgi:lipopolysaccharide export system protein LptA
VNPKFTLKSDTLCYNTATKIANIVGPSDIDSEENHIYSELGFYDTQLGQAELLNRSVLTNGGKRMTGDSLFYDRNRGIGEAFNDVVFVDTIDKNMLTGNYCFYNQMTSYAFATDEAVATDFSQGDSLFIHADTLQMVTIDSTSREIKAFYGVRFYRKDMQGVCDSIQLNTRDSVLYMYKNPVLWNEQYQLYGDTVAIYMNDSTINYAHVIQFAFAAQFVDSSYYNQLKGNDLKAYFEGQTVRQIDVEGNAESIFYPLESDGSKVGMNETKSGFLTIWVKDNKLDRLKIWPNPVGTMTPIPDLKPDQKMLKDFHWFDYMRPKNKDDIYQVVKRKEAETPKRNNKFVH